MPDDDPVVRMFYQAAQMLGRLADSPERTFLLRQRFPGLIEAVTLYQTESIEKLALLDGFILSDTPPDEIAARFSMLVDTVRWYELLCFDVRTRLDKGAIPFRGRF